MNLDNFDVAMVATLRPELIVRTLRSFMNDLWGQFVSYATFYVNVDLAGVKDEREIRPQKDKIAKIFRDYFGDKVVLNFKKPHFPTAWLWSIQNTTADLVFHLEEDWVLNHKLDFEKMYGMFNKYPKLKHLRLNQFKSDDKATKLWGKYFARWNGDFFDIDETAIIPVGWCGHPSLNDGKWLRALAKDIDPNRNPEKQFHHFPEFVDKWVTGNQFGIYQPQNSDRTLQDIGREWMREHGFAKTGGVNSEWFTHWKEA